ncbi:MAG: hypothetical protein HY817_04275 [Candidatus Abawacabacteria bacterium]|nr:hypothetical protein [Candidatus Abawacabacteria bacterium]
MNCRLCSHSFTTSPEALAFIDRISPVIKGVKQSIDAPRLCPRCRALRRCAFRNEHALYHRKCDLSGHEFISIYVSDAPYKVYEPKEWWSDRWDPLEYGRDYDFSRPFFEQFAELQKAVPRLGMVSMMNENSDYTNYVSYLKNCYLVFTADYNQDCLYGVWVEYSKDCVDNFYIDHCDLTYNSFFSQNIYNSSFILNSSECHDSAFLYDCKACHDCFLSVGLRNKKYHIENQPYSKAEYEAKRKTYDLGSNKQLKEIKKSFFAMLLEHPRLFMQRTGRINNSSGNMLTDTENCLECFDVVRAKDCRLVQNGIDIKDLQDCCYVIGEFGYENCECAPIPFQSAFNLNSYTGSNLWYTDTCMNNCQNCFGCISLRHKEYCVLNKQYTKEQYEELLPKIIAHMKSTGEWGEFFPIALSPFAYNETSAYDHFPLTKERALAIGAKWKEDIATSKHYGQELHVPDHIKDVTDEITKQIFTCITCQKQYRIIQQELKFYRQQNLAIPQQCFDCRHRERLSWKNNWTLWDRNCAQCNTQIQTTYSPERKEILYCEKCYLKSTY